MDYQHSQRYPRPPPHPSADPHHQPPMRQPAPPVPWYPGQFQYQQQPPSHHSPSPPPPHPQWPPPPHSDHLPPPPYGAPPPPPPPHLNYNQYAPPPPPPRPHVPPQYHPQAPQSYNQDWGNMSWGHQQGRDYPGTATAVKEEDWAAKAREWAATNTGIDSQHSQVQYTPVNRLEEHSHFHGQYPQTVDPRYPETLHSALPASSYQQSPVPGPPSYTPASMHQRESVSMSSGQTSFVADEHYPYKARDGDFTGHSATGFSHLGSSPTTSSVHLQEVPSSYSSVTGKVETGDQTERSYKSFPSSIDPSRGLHQMHPPLPDYHRSFSVDSSHYAVNNQAAEPPIDLSDQPLEFAPRFNHDQDPVTQSSHIRTETMGPIRGLAPVAASSHSWNPSAPGVYPHIPPAFPSTHQFDPSTVVYSPVPEHSAPVFGRMPGPMFQPTIPSGGAPIGTGAGSGLNPTTAFAADGYGTSGVSERQKKVPNWLKEAIIKNKAVITSSAPDKKEETESLEDEYDDKLTGKADQADSKSVDSSRATEDEDDDEDYVEVTRTAAINQEIKRILTEVLLKVTDELFDEIATKVLSEDDHTAGVNQDVVPSRKLSPSAPAARTPKPSSAKVLLPAKVKAGEAQNASGKSTSSPPGNVLRLVNYGSDGSDDDGDDDGDSDTANQLPRTRSLSKDKDTVEDAGKINSNGVTVHHSDATNELNGYRAGERSSDGNVESSYSSKMVPGNIEDKDNSDGRNILKSANSSKPHQDSEENGTRNKARENVNTKKSAKVDTHDKETRSKHDKKDRYETQSPSRKDTVKEDNGKDQKGKKDEKYRKQEEKHARKERTDDRNGSNERRIEQGDKYGEKDRESDSRKRSSHSDVKEDVKVKERDRRDNDKENGNRRGERPKDEKTERSRARLASESSRHKRRRSSSASSRGRSSRDDSVNIHANGSSDHSSDGSKRKQHTKTRYLSPSPSRSRKRQDSRSPHSKRSQRRHSPYSSLETPRGRRSRSRSRSPGRRKR